MQQAVLDALRPVYERDRQFTCVELGVGNGDSALALFQRYPECQYTGVDWDQVSLDRTRRRIATHAKNGSSFIRSSFSDFCLPAGTQVILSVLALHHLEREEFVRLVRHLSKMKKDNGVLIWADLLKSENDDMQKLSNIIFDSFRRHALTDAERELFRIHTSVNTHHFFERWEIENIFRLSGYSHVDLVWSYWGLTVFRIS